MTVFIGCAIPVRRTRSQSDVCRQSLHVTKPLYSHYEVCRQTQERAGERQLTQPSWPPVFLLPIAAISDAPSARFPFTADSARARVGDGYFTWLDYIWPAAACTRPIRLRGQVKHIDPATGELLRTLTTNTMPDQVMYNPAATAAPAPAVAAPKPIAATPTTSSTSEPVTSSV